MFDSGETQASGDFNPSQRDVGGDFGLLLLHCSDYDALINRLRIK